MELSCVVCTHLSIEYSKISLQFHSLNINEWKCKEEDTTNKKEKGEETVG